MGFDLDEDILQDFLVEAGEILELLQEQLVELENNPDDSNLLNAIFRGFHTVKGGAGFLSLTELVDACHGAENVFDILRTGKRRVTSELMDVILQALDAINQMFSNVQNRQPLEPASPELLHALHRLSEPESADESPAPQVVVQAAVVAEPEMSLDTFDAAVSLEVEGGSESQLSDSIDDITEDEFERLLDELHGTAAPGTQVAAATATVAATVIPAGPTASATDDITDDEFEAILDQLHGKGSFVPASHEPAAPPPAAVAQTPPPVAAAKSSATADEISEDDFESLLDELHGKGKAPAGPVLAANAVEPVKAAAVAKAEPAVVKPVANAAANAVAKPTPKAEAVKAAEPAKPAPVAAASLRITAHLTAPAPPLPERPASHRD